MIPTKSTSLSMCAVKGPQVGYLFTCSVHDWHQPSRQKYVRFQTGPVCVKYHQRKKNFNDMNLGKILKEKCLASSWYLEKSTPVKKKEAKRESAFARETDE